MGFKIPKSIGDVKVSNEDLLAGAAFGGMGVATKKILDKMMKSKKVNPPETQAEFEALQKLAEEYASKGYTEHTWEGDLEFQQIDPSAIVQQQQSEMANISTDPRYAEAEMASLALLEEMSREGLTAQDKADLAKIEKDVNRNLRGQRGSIEQNMQARGIQSSGLDLVAQQQAAQSAAERQALSGLEKSAMMQNRKRQATMDLGQMSGQMSQRDFERQARQAQAQDAINRFNTQNSNKATYYNNDGVNSANRYNTSGRQGIADQNIDDRNRHQDNAYKARTGAGIAAYDKKVDDWNRQQMLDEQERKRKGAILGAVTGIAGGVAGGYFGGPAGASAGYGAGSSVGGAFGQNYAANGGKVPGKDNDIDTREDDTFNVNLQSGEIVIPDSIAENPDEVAAFVEMINASGEEGEIPSRNPIEEIPQEEDDVIDSFLNIINHLGKRRK